MKRSAGRDGIFLPATGAFPTNRHFGERVGIDAAAARAIRLTAVRRKPDTLELIERLGVGHPQDLAKRQAASRWADKEMLRQGANPCAGDWPCGLSESGNRSPNRLYSTGRSRLRGPNPGVLV